MTLDLIATYTSTTLVTTTGIPIDQATTTPRILYRAVPGTLAAGQVLDISSQARVTNNAGYPNGTRYVVGVGWYVKAYLYNNPPWSGGPAAWNVSPMCGENVSPVDMHHMPLFADALYTVPAEYDGQRLAFALYADAHSTSYDLNGGSDTLDVDAGYGQIIIRHYAPREA